MSCARRKKTSASSRRPSLRKDWWYGNMPWYTVGKFGSLEVCWSISTTSTPTHTHTALDILIWSLLDNAWIIHGSTNRPNQARGWPKHMPKSSKALTTSGWSLERVRSLLTSVWRNQNSASAGRCIRAKHLARLWTVPLRISGCERQDMPGLSSLEGLG